MVTVPPGTREFSSKDEKQGRYKTAKRLTISVILRRCHAPSYDDQVVAANRESYWAQFGELRLLIEFRTRFLRRC